MRIRPLNNTVVIEPDGIEKYQGKIVLPDKNSEEKRSSFATVISWGPKCSYKFKPGQRINYNPFNGSPIFMEYDGKLIRFIMDHDVRFVYED